VHGHRVVDLQDRVPAEELTRESASFPTQVRSACRRGAH
jgi:hypothetical protein